MAVTGIETYASYTNSYGNTQNAGNKTGRTYKNAHEYKNYLIIWRKTLMLATKAISKKELRRFSNKAVLRSAK